MNLQDFASSHAADLTNVATAVRVLGMDAVLKAKSGHVGLPLGGADMGAFLYFGVMNHAPRDPHWPDRDRFVLSAGHGSMLQYALLHLAGYDLPREEIVDFRQLGSLTPGHPEYGHTAGVEVTTGPLGQGIANAVGMALAERMLEARFNGDGPTVIDHDTYVILGDGCMMEGVAAEACSLAGHLRLNRLVALYDANNITIDGTIDIAFTEDVGARFAAYGWNVLTANGNDFASLAMALETARANTRKATGSTGPTLVVCRAVAGKGSPKWEGKPKIHGNPMSAEDVIEAKTHLGLDSHSAQTPFHVPPAFEASARALVAARTAKYETWQRIIASAKAHWAKNAPDTLAAWERAFERGGGHETRAHVPPTTTPTPATPVPAGAASFFPEEVWASAKGRMATRVASGKALAAAARIETLLVGGSADLAGSNNTTLEGTRFVSREDFGGRNIHFGVREHGMGAISNGIALHGGLRPYCATFAVFSDYMRPAVRLAALMKVPSIFLFTHDSYAVGEDGPTHQPVEHAASLRAIPDLDVFRPADALETFAAWQTAMEEAKRPTVFLLTRQDLPDLDDLLATPRSRDDVLGAFRTGGYLLRDFGNPDASRRVCLVASGSEVQLALRTALELEKGTHQELSGEAISLAVRVVSAPAPQLLARNPLTLNALLPVEIPTVAVEAGSPQGWGEIVGRGGAIFAMPGFGASAPAARLDAHFGFVPEALGAFVRNYLRVR